MGVMMLAAGLGTAVDIVAEGSDEETAARELESLVLSRFGEDE
jgi:phosphocarrier protein